MYFVLEIIGTIAFAMSGAMVAIEKKMDILGVIILGTTTAIGGGVIRDIIIGSTPPTAFINPLYAIISILVSLIVFIPFVRSKIDINHMLFVVIDAIGLASSTVVGVDALASFNSIFMQVFLGVLTGVGGGVLRDIFASEKPSIFMRHFYASASIIGALVCVCLYPINRQLSMIIGMATIITLRILAAKFKWNLPKAK